MSFCASVTVSRLALQPLHRSSLNLNVHFEAVSMPKSRSKVACIYDKSYGGPTLNCLYP